MNQRLQQLADQATEDILGVPILNQKLFAELIVRECVEQIITGPNGPAHYAVEAAVRVKKHFGVDHE